VVKKLRVFDRLLLYNTDASTLVTAKHRIRHFASGDILGQADSPISEVLLVSSGLVSVVVDLSDGEQIETAMAGPGVAIGAAVVFGEETWLNTSVAHSAVTGLSFSISDLSTAARRDTGLQQLLFKSELWLKAQAQQLAACNAKHNIRQRVCTWLLRAHDALQEDDLPFTQEMLAHMLGARRGSVSKTAHQLMVDGIVEYRRGHIRIDGSKLEPEACECVHVLREHYKRVFA
jgi:CRP-like cAMP-binding protein